MMNNVSDIVYNSISGVFGMAQSLYEAFDFASFMLGVVFLLLVGRLLLGPLFRKDK